MPSPRSAPRLILPSQPPGPAGPTRPRDTQDARRGSWPRDSRPLRPPGPSPRSAQAARHALRRRRRQPPVPPAMTAPGQFQRLLDRVRIHVVIVNSFVLPSASPARPGSAPLGGDSAGRAGRAARAGPRSSPGCSRPPRPAACGPSAAAPCAIPRPPRAPARLPPAGSVRVLPAQRPSFPVILLGQPRRGLPAVLRTIASPPAAAASRAMSSAAVITASASPTVRGMQDWRSTGPPGRRRVLGFPSSDPGPRCPARELTRSRQTSHAR